MNIYEGKLNGHGLKIAIVVARFNEFITSKLLGGALDVLKRQDVADEDISVVWVPGSFEIPLVAKKFAASGNYDAVICLGAVIRGATTHYDYVCNEVSKGVAAVGLQTGVPVIFGVVTTENIQQAIERAGTKAGNKGSDAATSAIEMANLLKKLPVTSSGYEVNVTGGAVSLSHQEPLAQDKEPIVIADNWIDKFSSIAQKYKLPCCLYELDDWLKATAYIRERMQYLN